MKSSPILRYAAWDPAPSCQGRAGRDVFAWTDLQAFLAVDAPQAFMVHRDPLALEKNLKPAPAEARPFLGDTPRPIANQRVVELLAWLVLHRRSPAAR